jgi:hypothetical protein
MKKVYIFSYGLQSSHITLETLAAMRECGVIYTHCLDAASARHFSRLAPGLKLLNGLDRRRTARAAVAGLKKHDTVGFMTYGNPLFLNQTAAEVMAAAAEKKAQCRVFAAVSSFDAMVNLFNLNNFSLRGLRVVDTATSMDRGDFTPDMDTLFFVPYALNRPANAAIKKRFIAAAAKAYPPSARVYLADCASVAFDEPRVLKGHMGAFGPLLAKLNERHTLYIPAVAPKTKKAAPK